MIVPRAVQPGHAEGGGAHPEQAAVCDDVHGRRCVPGVPDAEHVVEEAHDEESSEPARVGVWEVVTGDEEARPVAEEVQVFLRHVELREARLAEPAEEVDDQERREGDGVDVGRRHDDEEEEGVGSRAEDPEYEVPEARLVEDFV